MAHIQPLHSDAVHIMYYLSPSPVSFYDTDKLHLQANNNFEIVLYIKVVRKQLLDY